MLRSNERKIAEFPADVRSVVERVKKEEQRLFGRHCDVERLLREIRRHYLEALEEHRLPDGSPVELRGLANRLIKEQRGYRMDEFIVDLSRLAREGSPEIDGRRLELRSTRDEKKGMLLHDLAGLGYVGSLRFFREVGRWRIWEWSGGWSTHSDTEFPPERGVSLYSVGNEKLIEGVKTHHIDRIGGTRKDPFPQRFVGLWKNPFLSASSRGRV